MRQSRDSRRYIFKIRPKFANCRINVHSMRMQRKSCVCIVNLCREIVVKYSRTSLQLSHPIEVGALSYYLTGMRISRDCFANFVADFLFRSADFILVSNVCNPRIDIVHYNSTNVKRILYALYSFTEDFNIHPLRKKGTYFISHLRRNYVYLKKSAMWHLILI